VSPFADRHLRAVPGVPDPYASLRRAVRATACSADLAASLEAIAVGLAEATNADCAVVVATDGAGHHVEGRGGPRSAKQALHSALVSQSTSDNDVVIHQLGLSATFGRGAPKGALLAVLPDIRADEAAELREVVESFAELAELCVVAAHRLHAAESRWQHDALTGCLTRRAIDDALEAELARSARTGEPFSVAFLDIDGFKHINDEKGHLHGDVVLGVVGAALAGAARCTDSVGRYGGDEFFVVMPGADAGAAAAACARLTASVGGAAANAGVPGLKLSWGTATWADGKPANSLVAEADAAMFANKRSPLLR